MIILFLKAVHGSDNLPPAVINTRYPLSNIADHLVMEAAAKLSQLFHGNIFFAIFSDQGYRRIDTDTWYIRDINHQLIHADTAQN